MRWATKTSWPSVASSAEAMSLREPMCFFGMMRTWTGALGLMSSKARQESSSNTTRVGISFLTNLQNRQSDIFCTPWNGYFTELSALVHEYANKFQIDSECDSLLPLSWREACFA